MCGVGGGVKYNNNQAKKHTTINLQKGNKFERRGVGFKQVQARIYAGIQRIYSYNSTLNLNNLYLYYYYYLQKISSTFSSSMPRITIYHGSIIVIVVCLICCSMFAEVAIQLNCKQKYTWIFSVRATIHVHYRARYRARTKFLPHNLKISS